MEKTKVFIAYAREDETFLHHLKKYLAPLELNQSIEVWYDGEIEPGEVWNSTIKKHLHQADIILLLVSATALASPYFWNEEVKDALVRHERKEAIVVPVILSYCGWQMTDLQQLQALPKDAKPISAWEDESAAYNSVLKGIDKRVKTIQQRKQREKTEKIYPASQNKNNINFGKIFKIILPVLIGIAAVVFTVPYLPNLYNNDVTNETPPSTTEQATINQPQTQPYTDNDAVKKQANEEAEKRRQDSIQEQKLRELQAATEAAKKEKEQLSQIRKQQIEQRRIDSIAQEEQIQRQQQAAEKAKKEQERLAEMQWQQAEQRRIDSIGREEQRAMEAAKKEQERLAEIEKQRKEKFNSLPKPIQDLINNMVRIQGGDFTMGQPDPNIGCDRCTKDEQPSHTVTLSSYNIGKYEVTQAQWQAVMGSNPSHFKDCGSRCPVEKVSWNDVQEFIKKLNRMTGKTFRLPSEAEWEYAARGRRSDGYKYAGSDNIESVAWYTKNSYDKGKSHPDYGTHTVGTKSPNELGLYDMSGNVWEWCSDWYDENYYKNSPRNNPQGPSSTQSFRVLRGGSWAAFNINCRVADRFRVRPVNNYSLYDVGFRLAQTP